MGALLWLIGALVLAGIELFAGELTFLMLAGGALAAAGVSFVDVPLWGQLAVFGITSFALLFFCKPLLKARMRKAPMLDTSPKALIASQAVVVESVDAHGGLIRLDGSFWSARSVVPDLCFEEGETVTVVDIDGATAVVDTQI